MSVVVSDTSPLHYLILCGAEAVLPRLFERVIIPPTVFAELQQPNTPAKLVEADRGRPRPRIYCADIADHRDEAKRRGRDDLPSSAVLGQPTRQLKSRAEIPLNSKD